MFDILLTLICFAFCIEICSFWSSWCLWLEWWDHFEIWRHWEIYEWH